MMKPIRIELPTPFAVGAANAYLFLEPEPVLVDCGVRSDESWAALKAGLAEHGLQAADLRRVIITHAHVDHYGLAGRITQAGDAAVWIAEPGRPWLVDGERMWSRRIRYYEKIFLPQCGVPDPLAEMVLNYMRQNAKTADPVPAERVHTFGLADSLEMGGLTWQVIHAPGHASHQTCFFQPETRQFISADMLLPIAPTPVVETPPDGRTRIPSLPRFLESLDICEALDIEQVYPGHGRPFTHHRTVIANQRRRILQRKEECFGLVAQGVDTAVALIEKMYADRPMQIQFAGLWMLIGYLDLLIADGRVAAKEIEGVMHYQARG